MTPSAPTPDDSRDRSASGSRPVPLDHTQSAGPPAFAATATFVPNLSPGSVLGAYRLEAELGRGGMGVVFEALDQVLFRRVALKVMNPQTAADAKFRERFLREGRSVAALKSEHVVSVYAAGDEAGVLYLAMEFIEGPTLEQWLKSQPSVPLDAVMWVARELLTGLAVAHGKGLVHRDVKPHNLMIEPGPGYGRLKLLDFGLVRDVTPGAAVTMTAAVVGTPAYMSPEQARSQPTDKRTDLFSAGTVLYRMVAGQSPFARETPTEALIAVATEPAPMLTGVPAVLGRFIARLMSVDRDDRPADAVAALAELREVEAKLTATGRPAEADDLPAPESDERPPPKRRKTGVLIAWSALLLVLVVMAVGLLRRDKPKDEVVQNPPEPDTMRPPSPMPQSSGSTRRPLPVAEVLQLIRKDIEAKSGPKAPKAIDGKPARLYLFAPHLASGSSLTAADRAAYRAALDTLAAHLQLGGGLFRPLDPEKTLFAVEPRSEFRAPDGLFVGYPYGLSIEQPKAARHDDELIREYTGPVACVRADWLVRYAVRRLAEGRPVFNKAPAAPPGVAKWADVWAAGQVDLATAADELGADREKVKLTIRSHEPLTKAFRLGPLAEGKTVPRSVWESREFAASGFQELARELGLGSPVLTE